jgi:hypothetical protein
MNIFDIELNELIIEVYQEFDSQLTQVQTVNVENILSSVFVQVQEDYAPVQSVNGKIGWVTIDKTDVGLSNVENVSILGASGYLQYQINNLDISGGYATDLELNITSGVLNQKINNLSGAAVLTYGNQTINGVKNFTSLKRSNINVSVIPTLKDLFGDLDLGPFWDYDTLQLPAQRNVIYYVPTSWAPPLVRNIRLPRAGNLAGDSLIVSTNYMPPSSAINFYFFDPGPGWVLIDSWSNASFDDLYRPFNLSVITYGDSSASSTPWIKQANRWTITPPASINSAGTAGDLSFDGTNIYVCVGPSNWRRLSASTWN